MQKSLKLDPNKCTGCLQCEMACAYQHHKTFNTGKSRIKIFSFEREGRKVPYTCTQCDEAWCLHACPVEAIVRDARTGAKVVLEDRCVGCKVCTIACPFGTVNYLAVITEQAILLQDQEQAVSILTRRMSSSVLLIEALGGGWDASALPTLRDTAQVK